MSLHTLVLISVGVGVALVGFLWQMRERNVHLRKITYGNPNRRELDISEETFVCAICNISTPGEMLYTTKCQHEAYHKDCFKIFRNNNENFDCEICHQLIRYQDL